MKETGISKRWESIAESWLGDKTGRHCHWCKSMEAKDGEVLCTNKESKFCDGGRIRTWDGTECAGKCDVFELDDWYKSDENYVKTFSGELKPV